MLPDSSCPLDGLLLFVGTPPPALAADARGQQSQRDRAASKFGSAAGHDSRL